MQNLIDYNVVYIHKKNVNNIADYQIVSHERWANAVSCFKNNDYLASLYLAGYSAECILKYVILSNSFSSISNINIDMVKTYIEDGKDYKCLGEHKLNKLINLGNEKNIFKTPKESDFKDVIMWKNEWRYATSHQIDKEKAQSFLESVIVLSEQLKKELNGKIKVKSFQPL